MEKMNTANNIDSPRNGQLHDTAFAILFMVGFAHLLNDMIQSVIPAIYPLIKDKYNLSFAEIGLLTFVFQLASSLLQPFVGYYADRRPHPYLLSVGMVFTLAGLVLVAWTNTFATLLIAVCIIGWGSSVFHPGASQVAQLASGGKKSLAQAIFQVGGNGGTALGPLIAAIIVLPFGIEAIGYFAIAALIAIVVLWKVGTWFRIQLKHGLLNIKAHSLNPIVARLNSRQIKTAMAILVILTFSKYFFLASMTNYFTFFLIDKFQITVQQSQFCLFAFLAASAIGTVGGGAMGDSIGRKKIILISILGAAPFTLLLPYVSFWCTIILAVVIGLVISSAFSSILVYATDLRPNNVGLIAGLFFGLMFGLGGVFSAFFGWLADFTSIQFVFQISTLLPLVGAVALFLPDLKIR